MMMMMMLMMALVRDRLVGMLKGHPVAVIEYIIILLPLIAAAATTMSTVPTCPFPFDEVVGHHSMYEIKVQVSHYINIIIKGLLASISEDTTLDQI
jgi:hypothetical protein